MLNNRTLRKLRTGRRLTQAGIAAKAGVTREYITELESGVRRNPRLTTLTRLADTFGVEIDALVGRGR